MIKIFLHTQLLTLHSTLKTGTNISMAILSIFILSCGAFSSNNSSENLDEPIGDLVAQLQNSNDIDLDGFINEEDNCPEIANPDQLDTDRDIQGDVCDLDDDNDGILDTEEIGYFEDRECRIYVDCDGDGMDDLIDPFYSDSCASLDTDRDGHPDVLLASCVTNLIVDNCPNIANPDQVDTDDDSQGDACDTDDDADKIEDAADVDDDNDGLIEISSLLMLHNMRHDLDGTHYNDGTSSSNAGCPTGGCNGYELVTDLDFDRDGDGSTFSGNCNVILEDGTSRTDFSGCTIDTGDVDNTYFPSPGGWLPIGDDLNGFSGIFEGNGHVISNLYINRNMGRVGLFGEIAATSTISNIGLIKGLSRSSDPFPSSYSGGLAGYNRGSIASSYSTSDASSSSTFTAHSGGLVGNNTGTIVLSYATGDASSYGAYAYSGGLVGYLAYNKVATVTSSYATGDTYSSATYSYSGGLVGFIGSGGTIDSSYATGDSYSVSSFNSYSFSGGLVGYIYRGKLISSYWSTDASQITNGVPQAKRGIGNNSESATGLTESQLKATNGTYPSELLSPVWDLGTASDYPGLALGDCVHRPTGSVSTSFNVISSCNNKNQVPDLTANKNEEEDDDDDVNSVDAFPTNPDETVDTDKDSIDDNVDNCPNIANPDQSNIDFDTLGDACDPDDDNDGIADDLDAFPLNASETVDTDGDRIGDNADFDDDNDGVLDVDDTGSFEGRNCNVHPDCDDDGVRDAVDAFPTNPDETVDTDKDSIDDNVDNCPNIANPDQSNIDFDTLGDACDLDDDNDGVADDLDVFPLDKTESVDTDGDGIGDNSDNCPNLANPYQLNIDDDTLGDACDLDDDNDGVADDLDAFPLDKTESVDTDDDGTGDNVDPDDDNDGVLDVDDLGMFGETECRLSTDCDNDTIKDLNDNCRFVSNLEQINTDKDDPTIHGDELGDACDVDDDNDGLIEISSLLMLHNMRNDLRGRYYSDGTTSSGAGCPSTTGCNGYELVADLDFDTDGDGSTFVENALGACNVILDDVGTPPRTDFSGCSIDTNDSVDPETGQAVPWFHSVEGWAPIANFAATFEGNGHTISNLYIHTNKVLAVGLFGDTLSTSRIRNIGLLKGLTRSNFSPIGSASLVGENVGTISSSYTTGNVSSSSSYVGGLVGENDRGNITSSYAAGNVAGLSQVGGLVGYNIEGTITSSYATGNVSSSAFAVGGLVGGDDGTIASSYAIGNVSHYSFNSSVILGGLMGYSYGTITSNYWNTSASQTVNGVAHTKRGVDTKHSSNIPTGLTETQFQAITGTYPSELTGASWNLGTASEYPGLLINKCVHKPTGSAAMNFTIIQDCDTDGDGLLDSADAFPLDSSETVDTDGDGIGDNSDNCPNVANPYQLNIDTDTLGDACDSDDDNDGVADDMDAFAYDPCASVDTDKDGKPDNLHCPEDTTTSLVLDTDDDIEGIEDIDDVDDSKEEPPVDTVEEPQTPNPIEATDTDKDGLDDSVDPDDDDDGVDDDMDAFPLDASETMDTDKDGVGDNADVDENNNGLIDISDASMLLSLSGRSYSSNPAGEILQPGCPNKDGVSVCNGYELLADINISDTVWQPIKIFDAIFEGNGFSIHGLNIDNTIGKQSNIAFFERLAKDAHVRNISFVNPVITLNFGSQIAVLAASNSGTIENVSIHFIDPSSKITVYPSGRTTIAGLAAYNRGFIRDSYVADLDILVTSNVSSSANLEIGGFVGLNDQDVERSFSYGNIKVSTTEQNVSVGGFMQYSSHSVKNSYAIVNMDISSIYGNVEASPFLSYNEDSIVENTYAAGSFSVASVSGKVITGGLTSGNDISGYVGSYTANSYWDYMNTLLNVSADGESKTTQELACLLDPSFYSEWDKSIWSFTSDTDTDGCYYPFINGIKGAWLDVTDKDKDGISDALDVDNDGDGLIEIYNLTMLHNMRNDLDGSHYNDGATSSNVGCPTSGCNGYELVANLNFDKDGDGSTFSGECNVTFDNVDYTHRTDCSGCTIDTGDVDDTYFPSPRGWLPIENFRGIFEGNGYSISNLYINGNIEKTGFFATTNATSTIKNIALLGGLIHSSSSFVTYVGGLVGTNSGRITSSYVTGNVSGYSSGGLVGRNRGSITSSYTTGNVSGNYNSGGLVGLLYGTISSSYATGNISGHNSGGLVGWTNGATINSSYATGNIAGSVHSGGLVGWNDDSIISSSYAMGNVSGFHSGGLAGHNDSTISSSYWNTAVNSSGVSSNNGGTIRSSTALTEAQFKAIAGTYPSELTGDAWNLGTASDYPGLVIGECVHRPTGSASTGFNIEAICDLDEEVPDVIVDEDSDSDGVVDSEDAFPADPNETIDTDNDGTGDNADVDDDNDRLIEISSLLMLHNMRHDLDGTHYNDGARSSNAGCPNIGCNGYELVADLDFDRDGDGSTFSGNCNVILADNTSRRDYSGCNIDAGDVDSTYFPSPEGWQPIGEQYSNFAATFEGNGHVIKNLYIKRNTKDMGLFALTGYYSNIRNIGLVGGLIRSSFSSDSSSDSSSVGSLVGYSNCTITSSYATADVVSTSASAPYAIYLGGLVGVNNGSRIISSYATGDISSSSNPSNTSYIGGLVGVNDRINSSINSSYATGNISSSFSSSSYATYVGGLVGYSNGNITASYWNTTASQTVNGIVRMQRYKQGHTDNGTTTGLTETQFKAITGTYPSLLTGSAWNLGTDSDYPGLVIDECVHRPTGSASIGFGVTPVCN